MPFVDELIQQGVLKTPRIIAAFRAICRVDFVPADERPFADSDEALPIGEGQTISQPYTVAVMLELLQPQVGETILDAGYGSGWQSALLAHIVTDGKKTAGRVYAIERIPRLCAFGKQNIATYNFITSGVVEPFCKDAVEGLETVAQSAGGFDKIIAGASLRTALPPEQAIPRAWRRHLVAGGKIVMPVNDSIWVFTKHAGGSVKGREYPGFIFVPLVISKKKRQFRHFVSKRFMHRPGSFWSAVAGILLVSIFLLGLAVPPKESFPKEVTVPRDSSAREIAGILKQDGIIRSENLFLAVLALHGDMRNIQAGTYFFKQPESLSAIARKLADPATRKIFTVRIPEGSTLRGIAEEYQRRGIFSADALWGVTGTPAFDYRAAKETPPDFSGFIKEFSFLRQLPPHATLEGFLMADTYELFDDSTPEEAVFAMLKNFEQKLAAAGLFKEIQNQNRTLYDVLIFASLLEKEAIRYEDKRIIAGIIQNRLERDMPLQLDASLMYVTGRGSLLLTRKDLDADHPYNTYVHKGLPVGPIANPGVDSIKAALFPEEHAYLYYLSDRDMTIYYSTTFEEHKTKKAKYIP